MDEINDPKTARIIRQPMKLPENTETPQTEAFKFYELLREMEKVALAEHAAAKDKFRKAGTYEKLVAIRSLGWAIQISPSKGKVLSLIRESYDSGEDGEDGEVLTAGRKLVAGIRACEFSSPICFFDSLLNLTNPMWSVPPISQSCTLHVP